jgi:hypothetical protein
MRNHSVNFFRKINFVSTNLKNGFGSKGPVTGKGSTCTGCSH